MRAARGLGVVGWGAAGRLMASANLVTVETMWRREVEAAHTYRLLAEREPNPQRRDILLRLADQENKHAARWSARIEAATGRRPDPTEIERGMGLFERLRDPLIVLRRLEQEENKAEAEYNQLLYSDLPHAEIATAIDCSEEAARRSVHEGLKRLREVIA